MTEEMQVAKPKRPVRGFAVRAPGWRVVAGGKQCRYVNAGERCPGAGIVESYHDSDPISKWRAYCLAHSHGRWAENGEVLHWEVRNVVADSECRLHHCRRSECLPEWSHNRSVRLRDDLWAGAGAAADAGEAPDVSEWIRQAMEARLGSMRCYRCPEASPAVPVAFGDLTGKPLGEWIAEAAELAAGQHPRHEPLRVGAEPAAVRPGTALFMEPGAAPVAEFPVPDRSKARSRM